MKDIIQDFGTLYHPTTALVFYQNDERNIETYVEHFDMDKNGNPINAHPLTEREAETLAKALIVKTQKEKKSFGVVVCCGQFVGRNGNSCLFVFSNQPRYFTK